MKNLISWALAAVSGLGAMTAAAADISLSGFGTVGYAQSDQSYNYQRFVNNQGTFKRDSVLGVQMDAKLNDEFGFTLQGKVAPSLSSDKDWDATVSWAFLSWRPTNDWLVRVGRVRVPLYLNSENMEVGATFDFARLPAEVYTTSQATEGDGLFVSKTWNMDAGELTLNGYSGSAKTNYRFYRRDDVPPLVSSGSYFVPVKVTSSALVLTFQHDDNIFRAGAHDTYTKITDDHVMPVTFPYVAIMPGVGYYQTSNLIPGPGVLSETKIHAMVYTLAADVVVGNDFRVMGEYVRRDVPDIATGPDSQGAYLAVLKPVGAWTPYVSVARLESMARTRELYNKVNSNTVPGFIPGAAQINAAQRAGADGIIGYDQTTWAFGTSYRVTPTSKLKAEWARTRTGDMSSLIDAPSGDESGKKTVNVFSFSYSVVF
jgi:hypothetical protein